MLNRICSGRIALKCNGKTYFFIHPSPSLMYKADILELDILESTEGMTKEENNELLELTGKWSKSKQKEIDEEIPKILEDLKMQVYVAYLKTPDDVPDIKVKITKIKDYLYRLLSQKHKFDEYTKEGIAKRSKTLYLIKKCVKKLDIEAELLINALYSSRLDDSEYRRVARSEEWIIKWKAMKAGCKVFDGYLNEEQEYLIKWTTVYEHISEFPEPPPKCVIEDDDALDGFFLYKNIESKDKALLEQIENRYAQRGMKHGELYLPAANMEEAKRNNKLNTPEAIRIKEARFKQIAEQGTVNEADLKDRRLQLDMAKNRLELK